MRTIQFYRTERGICPVAEFLDSLSGKQAQKVVWVLRLIEEMERIPANYLQKLVDTDDIWEVRAQFGGEIFRLLGFFPNSSLFVLTNGFAKKSPKTPRQEIATATQRKQEFSNQQRLK